MLSYPRVHERLKTQSHPYDPGHHYPGNHPVLLPGVRCFTTRSGSQCSHSYTHSYANFYCHTAHAHPQPDPDSQPDIQPDSYRDIDCHGDNDTNRNTYFYIDPHEHSHPHPNAIPDTGAIPYALIDLYSVPIEHSLSIRDTQPDSYPLVF